MASLVLKKIEVTLQVAIGTKMENPKRVQFEFKNSFELDFYCSNHGRGNYRCIVSTTVHQGCYNPPPFKKSRPEIT
jgi:hypothetical protein